MHLRILSLFVFAIYCGTGTAQEYATPIRDSNFVAQSRINLSDMDGWYFRQGPDSTGAFARDSINGWRKMRPSELSERFADANGKLEGWFTLNFYLDKDLKDLPIGVFSAIWAASDVYINGKLLVSFGETGGRGNPYQENRPFWKEPISIELRRGDVYHISVHVVDYTAPFHGGSLKSAAGFSRLLVLTTAKTPAMSKKANQGLLLTSAWLAITGIISMLFWFFWLLNPRDKKQLLFALCSSFISFCILLSMLQYAGRDITYNAMRINLILFSVCMALVQLLVFTIITRVFQYKAHRILQAGVYMIIFIVMLSAVFPKLESMAAIINILYVVLCLFIVGRSWKNLKGAQWAIAFGLLSGITFGMFSFATGIVFPAVPLWANHLIYALAVISFPLGLMLYAAIRFKEINRETEIQAGKVIQLSEEKREQAVNQQKILEEEVRKQTADLRKTLENLKSTQAQLIQSEKMASLGELTAGIAHEIQNPLNFVNNFSEVNKELIEELRVEKSKGVSERDEKLEDELLNDISQNLEKINHHGKRADAIVKGMLQHSRMSAQVKEPTDMNKLVDEYLRLAYHGFRAKDNLFSATLITDFDERLGKIDVTPQDMGRVVLNQINNAFYAVVEKKKHSVAEFEPKITVSTKKINGNIEISIKDNGTGIPRKVVDKIFQPFYTTKPTGQGTGLGLSLSYDIVKAHGGELNVNTNEGEGSVFAILLPLDRNH